MTSEKFKLDPLTDSQLKWKIKAQTYRHEVLVRYIENQWNLSLTSYGIMIIRRAETVTSTTIEDWLSKYQKLGKIQGITYFGVKDPNPQVQSIVKNIKHKLDQIERITESLFSYRVLRMRLVEPICSVRNVVRPL